MMAADWSPSAREANPKPISTIQNKALDRHLIQNMEACPNLAEWTADSQTFLVFLQYRLGNQWSRMTLFFGRKNPNNIKNQFFSVIRRCFRKCCRAIGRDKDLPDIGSLKSTTLSQFFQVFCDTIRARRGCKEPENHIKSVLRLGFEKNAKLGTVGLANFRDVLDETITTLMQKELGN